MWANVSSSRQFLGTAPETEDHTFDAGRLVLVRELTPGSFWKLITRVGALLAERCPRASWVVNARDGEPTGYGPTEKYPDLHLRAEIIATGDELLRRIRLEKRERLNQPTPP